MNISEIEKAYEERAKTIFTDANIGPIVFYLNRLLPDLYPLTKQDEFSTLVHVAQIDGMKKLIELAKTSVLGNKQK